MKWRDVYAEDQDAGNQKRHSLVPAASGGQQGDYSDGDVAVHALCDALLGAAALGDIGLHFPDTAAEYAGIDSMVLLERCMAMLAREGFGVVNADVTVAMQRPRLRPHIDAMRRRLAAALGVELSRVSVKATTTERLGFVGREEGVEANAVVLIARRG